jgi:glycosyltransferase involved in cell wall biosynthesis
MEPLKIKAPIEVISNGINFDEIQPLPKLGSFRNQHTELQNDPFILFLSRLHYKKGLDVLAETFAQVAAKHPTVRLVVAGPDDGARDDFERRVKTAGLAERVHLVGPIYGKAKYEAIVDAACFCLPSRQEGFSVAIIESLAVGCPVVITEGCHFPEVAEVGAGIVTPLNVEQVAASLLKIQFLLPLWVKRVKVWYANTIRGRQLLRNY